MICPRCTHEIYPQDAVELVAGQTLHDLQTCFDFVHADLTARTGALATLTAVIGALQQAAITARTSEAQAVADMIDIQAQVDVVNMVKADNADKAAQIAQLTAFISTGNQSLAGLQDQLSQAQSNILNFAKERDAAVAQNIVLKAENDALKLPKP